ncbi:ATP synthase subunit I [Hydrogenovibrio halophilus]|uniref:ATP synthase subunit I n=1 Tax=Hydrogenovibrio halophilus TaxID=373391 RepID=UPI00037210B1|nr:ATP synthase subunit I [Hydrogenovibrio halophilus]
MNDAAPLKMVSASRAWKAQLVLGLLAVFVFAFWSLALDALYGLAIGLVNVAMLSWTFQKANAKAVENPKSGIQILYLSAVIRFVLLAVLFVLGLQAFELNPMPVVLTFVVMQIGQMLNLKGKQRLTD